MRRSIAIPIAILVWLAFAAFMWASMVGVNLGAIGGKTPAPWAWLSERIVFLPTLWLTRPLHQWMQMTGRFGLIKLSTVIEIALLATLYSGTIYLLMRGTLLPSVGRFMRRFGWVAAVCLGAMIIAAVWLHGTLDAKDHNRPLRHEAARVSLKLRRPEGGRTIELVAVRSFTIDDSDERSIIAREGAAPLSVAVRTSYIREPSFHAVSEYVVHRINAKGAERLAVLPINGSPQGEPRCAYGNADEVLIGLTAGSGSILYLMPFDQPSITMGAGAMSSVQALKTAAGVLMVGFGGNEPGVITDGADWMKLETHAQSGDLAVLRSANGKTELLGGIARLSDHGLNNVAATLDAEGMLRIVATEVAVRHDNSSIVHSFRFDPKARRWAGHEVLMARSTFTSTAVPRVARAGSAIDAFWHIDGGHNVTAEDGLYTRRLGEPETWHLAAKRSEFAVLTNADGRGGTLIGAATNPNRAGIVRWFYRDGPTWHDLGETDAGQIVYTMNNTGTEPFAIWRGSEPGLIHAAFNAIKHTVVKDLRLPPPQ